MKGAVAPEKPLSVQHWVDSAAVATAIVSPLSKLPVKTTHSTPSINTALKTLDASGLRPGQDVVSKTRIMDIVENYDPIKARSSVHTIGNTRYLVEGHHTTIANTILGKGTGPNMGVYTSQMPSSTDIYWTKSWYEFGKKTIKIVE